MILALVVGGVLGGINGLLVAYVGFPALIATLATFYAYGSFALIMNGSKPVNSPEIQGLYRTARAVQLPLLPEDVRIPIGIFLFLLPTVVISWYLLELGTIDGLVLSACVAGEEQQDAGVQPHDEECREDDARDSGDAASDSYPAKHCDGDRRQPVARAHRGPWP